MTTRWLGRTPAPFPLLQHKYTFSESSASIRTSEDFLYSPASSRSDISAGGSSLSSPTEQSCWGLGAGKVLIRHAEAPYSQVGSIDRDTWDTEQPGPKDMQKLYILELVLSTETPEIWSSSNTNIDQGLLVKSSWGSTRTGSIVETVEEQISWWRISCSL